MFHQVTSLAHYGCEVVWITVKFYSKIYWAGHSAGINFLTGAPILFLQALVGAFEEAGSDDYSPVANSGVSEHALPAQ
jgi:hypothetical protein